MDKEFVFSVYAFPKISAFRLTALKNSQKLPKSLNSNWCRKIPCFLIHYVVQYLFLYGLSMRNFISTTLMSRIPTITERNLIL